jgi:hypothetical protein
LIGFVRFACCKLSIAVLFGGKRVKIKIEIIFRPTNKTKPNLLKRRIFLPQDSDCVVVGLPQPDLVLNKEKL